MTSILPRPHTPAHPHPPPHRGRIPYPPPHRTPSLPKNDRIWVECRIQQQD